MSAPLAPGVSHLLAADEALIPHRWGSYITLCGEEIREPDALVEEHECDLGCDCVRYCPDCAREAAHFSAEVVDQVATR